MTGTFKEFYKFIKTTNSDLCELWEDFHNRAYPQKGNKFRYKPRLLDIIFEKIDFDPEFKNGVAFWYYFKDAKDDNNIIKIHSINDVYDISLLKQDEKLDFLRFWKECEPIM